MTVDTDTIRLHASNTARRIDGYADRIDALQREVAKLRAEVAHLASENGDLCDQIFALQREKVEA